MPGTPELTTAIQRVLDSGAGFVGCPKSKTLVRRRTDASDAILALYYDLPFKAPSRFGNRGSIAFHRVSED